MQKTNFEHKKIITKNNLEWHICYPFPLF